MNSTIYVLKCIAQYLQVSDNSKNHIIMAQTQLKVNVCRYVAWYKCSSDFVICVVCYKESKHTK